MRRSGSRRAATRRGPDRRILGAAAALVVFGGIIGVTQISNAAETPKAETKADKTVNGLEILANTCEDSTLAPHDGFQKGDRCVSTEFGEVGTAANNPSLLITRAPRSVTANTAFTLKVSTRNLIRDRFLAAGQGGYYVESSVLKNGLVRGHFHTACRMLSSTRSAPVPDPVPAFFVATEDSQGSATPDTVTINVPGLPTAGTAQCASWAGDGSHRIPMMERANQTPAFDAVRITVRNGNNGGGNQGGGNQGGGQQGGGNQGGGQQGGGNQGGGQQGGNTGGQNGGGQTGGNTGGQTGGNNTEGDVTPNPPTKAPTKAPTKPPTKAPTKPASGSHTGNTTSGQTGTGTETDTKTNDGTGTSTADDQSSNSGDSTPAENTATKKAAKPAATKSKAATDNTYDTAADPDQTAAGAKVDAAPAAGKKDSKLALTGTNTFKVIGGGVLLLVIGLVVLTVTRRRRPRNTGW
jgi:hypothetical protein